MQALEGAALGFELGDMLAEVLGIKRLDQQIGAVFLDGLDAEPAGLQFRAIERMARDIQGQTLRFQVRVSRLVVAEPINSRQPPPPREFPSLGHGTGFSQVS